MPSFFISYTNADTAWAEWIAWTLEANGHTTVLQAWDFRPGANFVAEMQRAAQTADRTIAVLSPAYEKSGFASAEWAAAFARDPSGWQRRLLPVRIADYEPGGLLRPIIHIDLVGLDEAAARDRLLSGLKTERDKPPTPPRFPGGSPSRPAPPTTPAPPFPPTLTSRNGTGGEGEARIIHNLPHRNPAFTGRVELLTQLETDLKGQPSAALTQPHALHGLGGIGKTSLALEYAYRHLTDYDLVAWLRAEDPVTLAADLAALALPLGLPLQNVSDQTLIVGAVLRWLEGHSRWLLVYDNAPDPTTIRPYRPRTGHGHTLITSRHPDWTGDAVSRTVRVLPLGEAVDLLVLRSQAHTAGGAEELAKALGCLPLALVQAGAYMAVNGMPIADYLGLFETRRAELWQDEHGPEDYPRSVGATFDLALSDLARQSPRSVDLLSLCAFFAPEGIPLSVIQAGREHLPPDLAQDLADPLALNRLLGPLVRYSLLERQGDQLSIHRLVQVVAQDHLSVEEAHTWATTALTLLADAFPSDDTGTDIAAWPQAARLAPHALAVTAYTGPATLGTGPTLHLLHRLSEYLRARAQFSDARLAAERAVQLAEATLSPNDPDVAQSVNDLGLVLDEQGDLPSARSLHQRSLAIRETILGPDHPDTARSLNNLASVLRAQGDLATARVHFERALHIHEKDLGPEHPDTAASLNNLAEVLHAQGDVHAASALHERALALRKKILAPTIRIQQTLLTILPTSFVPRATIVLHTTTASRLSTSVKRSSARNTRILGFP